MVATVASAPGWAASAPDRRLQLRSEQPIAITHNQGVARIEGGWIFSGTELPLPRTDNLVRTDDDLRVAVSKNAAIPPRLRAEGYNHIGDIDVVGRTIYAPLEQPDYSRGHQVTAMYDARTLRFLHAVVLPQNENSFVTVDPSTMTAYSMQHFNGRYLTRYDVARGWKRLKPLRMSRVLRHTQGADVARGWIWISTSDADNDIYRVSLTTGRVEHLGTHGHPGGEGEGIDATPLPSGELHTLILALSEGHMYFQHFSLTLGTSSPSPSPSSSGSSAGGRSVTDPVVWLPAAGLLVALAAGAAVIHRRRAMDGAPRTGPP